MTDKIYHPYLEVWQLAKHYPKPDGRGEAVIVRDFNLYVDQGEFISIVGHSGCGKSTVLMMLAGLVKQTAGTIIMDSKEVVGPGPDRGVVFQSHCLLPWMTALENVLLGVDQVFADRSPAERQGLAEHQLHLVGLGESLHKRSNDLSLGMRQRVGLARAFALNPKMLLLDEPFGMLDALTRIELQDALLDLLAEDQKTALMVTHDVDEAIFLSDRIVLMTNGPAATVGKIITVPFPRPRHRGALLDLPEYYELREEIVSFLEAPHVTESAAVSRPLAAYGS